MSENEALEIARRYGYSHEVMDAMLEGASPEEALEAVGCLPDTYDLSVDEIPEPYTDEEVDVLLDQDFLYNNHRV